jgi:hypothetical protein
VVALEEQPPATPWDRLTLAAVLASAALLLAASLWALYQSRARLAGTTWQPPYAGVALPPPESDTRIVSPRPSVPAMLAVLAGLGLFGVALAAALKLLG